MTNGQSRLLEVLGVKERALEKQMSPRRKMLEMVSRASTVARLEEAGLISTDWYDATAASPHKKPATRRGGRKRLAVEKQRFYVIGCAVDEQFRKFGPAFKVLRELKIIDGNGNLNALRSELAKRRFAPKEIDVLLHARTPMGAAKSFDEFLEKRFPESRRKAYYLLAIHEHLTRIPKRQLREVGWTKARELVKVARRDGTEFDCAPWVHKAKELPKEEFRREVDRYLTGKETEAWEIIYFKLYKSQLSVVERALEIAALMLGSDKSRG
jgi:hypothetical protein